MSELTLASGFSPASEEQWRALAEKALKGASFDRLASRTLDGIEIRPLYPQTASGCSVGVSAGWLPLGRVDHPDPASAQEIARAELEGGAGGLLMVLADTSGGPCLGEGAELPRLLKDLDLSTKALHVEAGREGAPALAALLAAVSDQRPAELRVRFGLLNALLSFRRREDEWCAEASRMLEDATDELELRIFCADGRLVHNAGGSEAQELGAMLADLVAQLRQLEAAGTPLAEAAARMSVALAADTDQFASMAKLRAARLLVRRVLDACGIEAEALPLHVETSRRMLSRRDPWVNMLRNTAAVAAAGLGGADSVSTLPHSMMLGTPPLTARRLARNTQLILLEESGLGRVGDPAAGSGYVEALTEEYCKRAWSFLQEIEGQGGLVAALRPGWLQERIARTARQRLDDIRTRRQPLTGTSEYPWLDEPRARLHPVPVEKEGGWTGPADDIAPLPAIQLGMEFERLRDRSDEILQETGTRPSVFLAALGPLADHSTRTGWARAAFAAGGIDALAGPDEAAPDDVERAFAESGCAVACLCGTDEAYAGGARAAAEGLKRAGCARVFLAGRPKEIADDLTRSGVDAFLYAGCDIIEALESAYAALGAHGKGAAA